MAAAAGSAADAPVSGRREMYPAMEPFNSGMLKVSDVHSIYYEESGNKAGKPAVFVHGGPGGGTSGTERGFFDPAKYRIVLIDQRGCGKSTPHAEIEGNTTWDLVSDIEAVRKHLGIEKWLVFGGSWGSTLSITYAITHPEAVTELVLRGIFLLRRKELEWFYQEGASFVYPDAWETYLEAIPEEERGDMMAAYHKRLTSDDPKVQMDAARAWSVWEGMTSKLIPQGGFSDKYAADDFALAFARIENTFFVNGGWFESETWHFDNIDKIRGKFPIVIVQGRYDMVCPMTTAWELKKALGDDCEFHLIKDAGHSAGEPGIQAALLDATDKFASL
ncbi:hypothetical protein FNF27_06785 [Cafeteria roenbergensis]|uniref:Proline iminopeptidase n=1 Tax=Cafeteria roenbergensis TaxID=33653 RepID=A0A5A8DPS9_CAFRO|nr:hypothetical protein FNF29_03022 [Cafeteria roenbergensis]KAA0163499.1 hypothetical protein FNF31_02893 [Cafeteria roenbergensis]KAA0165911.1 hypothetical protein FNF28_03293 [Cafeteria roenbergensis]KAA0170032.1 hypothetical protein FNF27_06785 [Cafeteria roenbergensis]|eukprot:KAA0153634.1 hypothetical protein FNF29_03022 [Cafeteria roenbergensis]